MSDDATLAQDYAKITQLLKEMDGQTKITSREMKKIQAASPALEGLTEQWKEAAKDLPPPQSETERRLKFDA